jgi:hypothetical protein
VAWATDYVRTTVRGEGIDVEVGDTEPDDLQLPLARPLVVIRDDSGPRQDWTTFGRTLGVTVLGGTKQDDQAVGDLARLVAAILFDPDIVLAEGSQIASVLFDGCNGPYNVPDELDVARKYMTAQYVVSGSW